MSGEGSWVRLQPATEADYSTLYGWRTDPAFAETLPVTKRNLPTYRDYAQELHQSLSESITFLVVDRRIEDSLGFVRGYNINPVDGWAWMESYASAALQQQPYKLAEAVGLLADHLFRILPLRKLCTEVYEYNETSLRLSERLGFRRCVTLPEHVSFDGLMWNSHIYAITRDAWAERRELLRTMLEAEREVEEQLMSVATA
jgi:RimJ/RimL family protein N-acetyltransferase